MKVSKTYSIEHTLFEKFDDICKRKDINRSQWIEEQIKIFVAKEMTFDSKNYKLKLDDNNYVSIKERKDNFVVLSNGNVIDVFDFEKMYEEFDPYVNNVLDVINGNTSNLYVEEVKPEILETTLNAEKIKNFFENVDLSKIPGNNPTNKEVIEHHPVTEGEKFRGTNTEVYDEWMEQMNKAMKDMQLPELEIERDEFGNVTSMRRKG